MTEQEITRRQFVRDTVAAAAGLTATYTVHAGNPDKVDTGKIVNYNPDMEYRRCGRTGLMVSAVCLGGHWKRMDKIVPGVSFRGKPSDANLDDPDFANNRRDVVSRCIERGVNYIDACTGPEIIAYTNALKGRRDKMYIGYSWYTRESWSREHRTLKVIQAALDDGMKQAGLEYVDVWRHSLLHTIGQHTDAEIEVAMAALDWAKKTGRARFTGISSHDRPDIKTLIEKYPDQIEVVLTPYTAKTKTVSDESGLWATMRKHDVGWFGIKPFANNSLFKGDSTPGNPHAEEDNRLARLAIRYILCNPAITAPIPGLITTEQVDNVALAVKERRELDANEKAELKRAMQRAWANLPKGYQWLRDWEYV